MTSAEKFVAAAYLVVFAVVLAWVLIIGTKLTRLQREVAELEAAEPPVRASGPVEGVRGNRAVPPREAAQRPVRAGGPVEGVQGNREVPPRERRGG